MTIKQLLEMPIDKDKSKCGGFQLTVKRARSTREHGKKYLQEVLLLDSSGEIPGEVLLPNYVPLQNNANINIIVCWLQPGEKGPKLYVEQWSPVKWSAEGQAEPRTSYNEDMQYGEPLHIVKSKVKMHVVCAMIQASGLREGMPTCNDSFKKDINEWVEFIVTGE